MSLWPEMANRAFAIKFIDAGGINTRYLEAGNHEAPAIIFIHGTGGHLETFNRNVFEHAKHFRVLALDMVGHGYSSKPDHPYEIRHYVKHLADFMAALGIKKAHMHGESMGGWIAAQFAIDHPEAVERLVLNTAGGLNTDEKVMERVYSVTMNAVKEGTFEAVRKRLEWLVHEPSQIPDDLVELRQNIYRQPGFAKSMENILCLQFMETRMRNVLTDESLGRIKAKTLVIWTDHDPTAPVATGERFARAIPDARLVVMSDCAHWPQWEKTEEFNKLHTAFLLGQ
ncbi:MAG: alpha/beta fold hydrolase [Pseudomonadota bacterium]